MSRIPESFIQDLLARIDIVEIIGARVELKHAGRELKGLSPFTSEKSPSFFVNPQKQMFFDFSSGKNGNAIGFLMEFDRLSYVEAIEELAHRAGVEVPREAGAGGSAVLEGPLDALAAAQRFFLEQLRHSPQAIDYLKKRGVNGETAKRFGIGYAPDRWDALTHFVRDSTRHALTAGLLIERDSGGTYDRFRHRVMFPIRDARARVIGFGGRALGDDPAKYLNSPETPLFHKGRHLYGLYEARQASKTGVLAYVLVVEGYMDVVMLSQHGITGVVATLGTATTREHVQLLFKSTRKVVFCFDGDRAGRSAAWRALDQVLPEVDEGRECAFMFLPEGQDPDSLVQLEGQAAFAARIAEAQPLSAFLLGQLQQQSPVTTLEGRAQFVALARPYLGKLREGALRTLMRAEVARIARMSVAELDFSARLAPARPDSLAQPPAATAGDEGAGRTVAPSAPVQRLLQLLLEQPQLASQVSHIKALEKLPLEGMDLFVNVADWFIEHPQAHAALLLQAWEGRPECRWLQPLVAAPTVAGEQQSIAQEFVESLDRLHQRVLLEESQALLDQASQRELTAQEWHKIRAIQGQLRSFRLKD
ncbi:DNA primase [Sinimarinibacterium sp. NLF-5-8]|uniref:DNA primase n=1 Tax=Sinimarinibacterium sp. NLF-5-8 TaxID=2698684 RepID=UPI00137C0DCE|nr:DNA primase [Sinimarinibacterium sp. NLF-5-8]QHS10825.1 DNA primase [Sinimarinibacterium sp. NLF-5-8]